MVAYGGLEEWGNEMRLYVYTQEGERSLRDGNEKGTEKYPRYSEPAPSEIPLSYKEFQLNVVLQSKDAATGVLYVV